MIQPESDLIVPTPQRTVVFYKTGSGHEPVREWLKSLTFDERKRIGKELAKLQFYARWPAGIARFLVDGLWELRVSVKKGEARVLFFEDGNELVLVYGSSGKRHKRRLRQF